MKKFLMFLVAMIATLTMVSVVSATVLSFDDISSNDLGTIPDGYGGLNWLEFGYVDGSTSSRAGSGYDHGRISGDYVAFNEWGHVTTISNSTFNWNGTYFAGAWNDYLNIDISGFFNGNLLYQDTIVVNTTEPTWFQADYLGINSLTFCSYGGIHNSNLTGSGTHFAMDDFMLNEAAPVPEPATMLLLGSGLIGVSLANRRRGKLAKK